MHTRMQRARANVLGRQRTSKKPSLTWVKGVSGKCGLETTKVSRLLGNTAIIDWRPQNAVRRRFVRAWFSIS